MKATQSKRLIVSTVGTSLLTNVATDEARRRLNDLTNATTLTPEDAAFVESFAHKAKEMLATSDLARIRRASAELNGLIALNEGRVAGSVTDLHVLVTTDTLAGGRCAQLVQDFLQQHGVTVLQILQPKHLSTANTEVYAAGIRSLVHWCDDTLPNYHQQRYHIVFNLNGGFKSLQGYMVTMGMFYADDMIYLFEGDNAQLLHIPRMPVTIDKDVVKEYAVSLALMDDGGELVPAHMVEKLSPIYYDIGAVDGMQKAYISSAGSLIWRQVRKAIYEEKLLDFPGLIYEPSFQRDVANRPPQERIPLQAHLARAAALLLEYGNDRSVLTGPRSNLEYTAYVGSHHGIDHFRITDNFRVSCILTSAGLSLRHYGTHDQVTNNP